MGVNESEADLSGATVTTTSIYLIGRRAFAFTLPLISYVLLGAARMTTTVEGLSGTSAQEDQGVGIALGAGLLYPIGRFRLGGQYLLLRRESSIGGSTFAAGSNPLQIVISWPLKE